MNSREFFVGSCASAKDWLVGGGEMGKVVRAKDWAQTPLGPMANWPASLRTTVNLVLNSNFPISLAWGSQHTQIYNDGYWPICADKHPESMGQDFTECWASCFSVIGEAFRSALAGTTAFLEDQRMFLDRLGYLEETFFTFSFSPIRDETGEVVGLFHPATETTGKMLGQRRTRCLRDLAERGLEAQSLVDGLHLAAEALGEYPLDVPFALCYQLDALGTTASLIAHAGLAPGESASPLTIELSGADGGWPVAQAVARSQKIEIEDVRERFPGLICDPYPEPVRSAFVLPVVPPGAERPAFLLVAGASPRLPMSEDYRAFFDLLAAAVGTIIANAVAKEAERQRAEELAEIDRAKTIFFSNISHEFRTPLTLMLAPLEDKLAEEASLPPADQDSRLAMVHRNGLRLLKLVNALLDFARIEAGRMKALYEPTDLPALTADLAGNFRSACEQAGLVLQVDCPPLPEPVYVDRDLWEKIVLNLISNAFKYTLRGGITIRLQASGSMAELTVEDTGCGIPEAELPRIFERFHRIQGTPGRTQEGSGIGLALVHELVRLHGGTIRVDSRVGAGTALTIAIPFGKTHLPAEHLGTALHQDPTATGARPFVEEAQRWLPGAGEAIEATDTRPRIVLADDNADMRDYVARLLAGSYTVEAVENGEVALAAVRRQLPALVLSDVMMPQLDGFGLLRALREDEATRTVPVILLSARSGEEARVEGLEAGADDYLVKPFTALELRARVASHIDMARIRQEAEEARRLVQEAELLRASEARLRYVTEAAEVGTWDWHPDSGQMIASDRCKAIFGRKPEESFDYDIFLTALHPDDRERTRLAVERALAGKGDYAIDYRTRWPDGSEHWVHAKGRVAFDGDGKPLHMGGIVIDITERIRAAEAIRRMNAELEQRVAERTAELQAANQELQAVNHELDAFTYAVSHDLRGPLRGMRSFAQELVEGYMDRLDGRARVYLEEIDFAGKEMGELIEGLLTLSRSTRSELVPEWVDLSALAGDIRDELARLAPERRVAWQIEPGMRAWGDLRLLNAVMHNLLDNAWKYTGATAEPRIRVYSEEVDGQRWFCVADNGAGFDMEFADQLFKPFERLHKEEEFPGVGVGLATVQRIIRRHGGTIEASATLGQGATFRFTLGTPPDQAKDAS